MFHLQSLILHLPWPLPTHSPPLTSPHLSLPQLDLWWAAHLDLRSPTSFWIWTRAHATRPTSLLELFFFFYHIHMQLCKEVKLFTNKELWYLNPAKINMWSSKFICWSYCVNFRSKNGRRGRAMTDSKQSCRSLPSTINNNENKLGYNYAILFLLVPTKFSMETNGHPLLLTFRNLSSPCSGSFTVDTQVQPCENKSFKRCWWIIFGSKRSK